MKVKAQTEKVIVVDLENEKETLLSNKLASPKILRIYADHAELDYIQVRFSSGNISRKTAKLYYHDWLIMSDALFRILHPKDAKSPLFVYDMEAGKTTPYKPLSGECEKSESPENST